MSDLPIEHHPVLSAEVLDRLSPRSGEIAVDATAGHGGHAAALAAVLGPGGRLIALDVDPANLARARAHVEQSVSARDRPTCHWIRANFAELPAVLADLGVEGVHILLADLGPSTDQLMDGRRGLSFAEDGPLDMRLDDRLPVTAMDLVNSLDEAALADLFWQLSQERFSRKIARRICEARRHGRIGSTRALVRLICSATGQPEYGRRSRIHPATRVFLALRMAVNRELENLAALLAAGPRLLVAGGRCAVISFHSGEDRLVKRSFLEYSRRGLYEVMTRKPIRASGEEIRLNPRSRSARLRVALRTAMPWDEAAGPQEQF